MITDEMHLNHCVIFFKKKRPQRKLARIKKYNSKSHRQNPAKKIPQIKNYKKIKNKRPQQKVVRIKKQKDKNKQLQT